MDEDMPLETLYEHVLREIGVLQINEAPSAEDRQVIEDKWKGLYGSLEVRGLAVFPIEGPIPSRFTLCVEAMLATHCARQFQTEYTPVFDVVLEFNRAVAPDYRHATTPFEDF